MEYYVIYIGAKPVCVFRHDPVTRSTEKMTHKSKVWQRDWFLMGQFMNGEMNKSDMISEEEAMAIVDGWLNEGKPVPVRVGPGRVLLALAVAAAYLAMVWNLMHIDMLNGGVVWAIHAAAVLVALTWIIALRLRLAGTLVAAVALAAAALLDINTAWVPVSPDDPPILSQIGLLVVGVSYIAPFLLVWIVSYVAVALLRRRQTR